MGLDDFVEDEEDDKVNYHDNPKLDKAKLWEENLCPDCGEEAKHLKGNQWKCTTDSCETITYYHTTRTIKNA